MNFGQVQTFKEKVAWLIYKLNKIKQLKKYTLRVHFHNYLFMIECVKN